MMVTFAGDQAGIPGLRVWWLLEPASGSLSGDWIDVVRVPGGRVGLTIGDAAGHDGQAAALAGVFRAVMRTALLDGLEPDEVLGRALDEAAALGDMGEMFATAFVAVMDLSTGVVTYANAGHPAPVVVPGRGGGSWAVRQLGATGPVLSDLFAGSRLWSSRQVALAADDRLLLYTDGLVEARDADGRPFGTAPLFRGRYRTVPVDQLLAVLFAEAKAHRPGRPCDDRSMAVLARVAPGAPCSPAAGGRQARPACPPQRPTPASARHQ